MVVEKPFGHDLESARELAADIHQYIDESQLYRIDHFLGKMGLDEFLYLRFANSIFEPVWNRNHIAAVEITMAESFGVEDRGHFYDPVGALRDVVVNHLMQLLAAAAMEAPAGDDANTLKDAKFAVFRSMPEADPDALRPRPVRRAISNIDGVASGSTTETYAAMRLEIDNWRWAGVPVVHPDREATAGHADRGARWCSAARRGCGFLPIDREPAARSQSQLVIKLDPITGIRLIARRPPRPTSGGPQEITLDMEFAEEGGEGPTPYEVLLQAAMDGDSAPFTRQDSVEETWRVMMPLLEHPPPVHRYAPGSWGPDAKPINCWRASAAGTDRGWCHEHHQGQEERRSATASAAAGRQRPRPPSVRCRRAPPRRRRSRRSPTTRSCRTATPGRWSRRTARSTGCASRGSTRRACSGRCWTAAPARSASGRSGSTCRAAGTTSRGPTRWSRPGRRRRGGRSCATR